MDTTQIVISVILPAYNAQNTIDKTIMSVVRQTFKDFELIIVNDGSVDSTSIILDKFLHQDSRIVVYDQDNSGANEARKKGVSMARGKFVCFIDADDTLSENSLERMLLLINDADVLICGSTETSLLNKSSYLNLMLDQRLPKELWGKLFLRKLLTDKVMTLPRNIIVGEDFIWNIRIAEYVTKVQLTTEQFYNYMHDSSGSIMKTFKKSLKNEEEFYVCVYDSVKAMGLGTEQIDEILCLQRFYSFFGIVRDIQPLEFYNDFFRHVSRPTPNLKNKINKILYSIMIVHNLKLKVFLLKGYMQMQKITGRI